VGGFFFYFEAVPRRREQLQSEGIVFRSQTDTEVIAQLIGRELDAQPDIELRDAVSRSLQKCEGTWGVAVLSVKDPDSVVVACNGSPMNIGLAPGKTFIASETSAFNRHTKNFIAMSRSRRPVLRCLQLVAISR
jgi:glucosamine--fructose-6-phosphate aminotransferase (isomerizing)